MKVVAYPTLDALPSCYAAFFDDAARKSFYLTRTWFEIQLTSTIPTGERVIFWAVEAVADDRPLALLAVRVPAGQEGSLLSRRKPGPRSMAALTNYYTCLYDVLVAPEIADPRPLLTALVRAIRQDRRQAPLVLEFNYLLRDHAHYPALAAALAGAGLMVIPYFHAATWFEPVAGLSAADYLAQRPKSIRQEYARKARKLENEQSIERRMFWRSDEIEQALGAFQAIYRTSWKDTERHPDFIPTLFRIGITNGQLRVGILYINGQAAAAQIYTLHGGVATAFKDAYDPAFAKYSPASVLRLFTVSYLIDRDRIEEINFGYGDEPYKRDWFSHRRELSGLLACDPASLTGLKQILWQKLSFGYSRLKRIGSWLLQTVKRVDRTSTLPGNRDRRPA